MEAGLGEVGGGYWVIVVDPEACRWFFGSGDFYVGEIVGEVLGVVDFDICFYLLEFSFDDD